MASIDGRDPDAFDNGPWPVDPRLIVEQAITVEMPNELSQRLQQFVNEQGPVGRLAYFDTLAGMSISWARVHGDGDDDPWLTDPRMRFCLYARN